MQGAGLRADVVTEMVSAKAILYKNKNTKDLLAVRPGRRSGIGTAVWLRSGDRQRIAAQIEDGPYAVIDVNMGCPVPKIVNNGEGSALMKRSEAGRESAYRLW